MKSCRDGFGKGLLELGKNKKVVALSADLSPSVRMKEFSERYKDRYFDVGVAEQNLVTVGSGLARQGKIPFISSFGAFCPGRCYEQIRTTIAYNDVNVKIIASHCGIGIGEDGATHQMLEDISMMRSLPNMTIVSPCDYTQAKTLTKLIAKLNGPCYMRFGREPSQDIKTGRTILGKGQILQKGKDIAIIGYGPVIRHALLASKKVNCSVRVINMHTIKPLDVNMILKAAKDCRGIITIEDHQINGGLGSAVCEVVSENNPVPVIRMGINDRFGQSGTCKELYDEYGLNEKNIIKNIKKLMK